MLTVQLLPAMGFMLVLRLLAIDLSVWMSFALGSVVSARLIIGGVWPMWAILWGSLAGLGVGFCNWLIVFLIRMIRPIRRICPITLAVPLATLVTAIIIFYSLIAAAGGKTVKLPSDIWANWHVTQSIAPFQNTPSDDALRSSTDKPGVTYVAPMIVTKMLFIAGFYSLVMLAILLLGRQNQTSLKNPAGSQGPPPVETAWPLAAALCVSGMLAGAGGACQRAQSFS